MVQVRWRDSHIKDNAYRAERANTDSCVGHVKMIILANCPNPYVIQAEVACLGKQIWSAAKVLKKLNFAVAAYDRLKEEATRRMSAN